MVSVQIPKSKMAAAAILDLTTLATFWKKSLSGEMMCDMSLTIINSQNEVEIQYTQVLRPAPGLVTVTRKIRKTQTNLSLTLTFVRDIRKLSNVKCVCGGEWWRPPPSSQWWEVRVSQCLLSPAVQLRAGVPTLQDSVVTLTRVTQSNNWKFQF